MHEKFVLLLLIVLHGTLTAEEMTMVVLDGTATENGRKWAELNRDAILHDIVVYYLQIAEERGVTRTQLIERAAAFSSIAEQIASHWLEEARAIADEVGIDREIYISFIANVYRNLFLHECTSYVVPRALAKDNAIKIATESTVDRWMANQSAMLVIVLKPVYKPDGLNDRATTCSIEDN